MEDYKKIIAENAILQLKVEKFEKISNVIFIWERFIFIRRYILIFFSQMEHNPFGF